MTPIVLQIGTLIEVEGREYMVQGWTINVNRDGHSINLGAQEPILALSLIAEAETRRKALEVSAGLGPLVEDLKKDIHLKDDTSGIG